MDMTISDRFDCQLCKVGVYLCAGDYQPYHPSVLSTGNMYLQVGFKKVMDSRQTLAGFKSRMKDGTPVRVKSCIQFTTQQENGKQREHLHSHSPLVWNVHMIFQNLQ